MQLEKTVLSRRDGGRAVDAKAAVKIGVKTVYAAKREHVLSGQKHALVRRGIFSSPASQACGKAPGEAVELINRCVDGNKSIVF